METGAITSHIDVAQVTLYAFWVFFAGLIWYLRQEDRREGYPLENDTTGAYARDPWLFVPSPKKFILPHGGGEAMAPNGKRDGRQFAMERLGVAPGSPHRPVGDPLLAGVGPGSWAERADVPDRMATGAPKIVPLSGDATFHLDPADTDPRGMAVIGCDGAVAGKIADLWIDRSEYLIRYYEVDLGARRVLVPVNFSVFKAGGVYVHAITAAQFANVPGNATPGQVTFLEEEKITAYFGAGQLYATAARAEPLV